MADGESRRLPQRRETQVWRVSACSEAGVGKTSFMAISLRSALSALLLNSPRRCERFTCTTILGCAVGRRYQIDPYKEKGTLPAIATFPTFSISYYGGRR